MAAGTAARARPIWGGTAIFRRRPDEIILKGTRIAAEMLEAAEPDISFADGDFVVAGTDRRVSLLDIAKTARGAGTPLDTYHFWTREWMTFPNGTHVAEVEIDRDTGQVTLERYTAVDDYGVLVNPMVATGQAHGAIAMGAGQALLETAVYDASRARRSPPRSWITRCRAPTICRHSASASMRRAARPIPWASKAAARLAQSPPFRRSTTRSTMRWRQCAVRLSMVRRASARVWRAMRGLEDRQ